MNIEERVALLRQVSFLSELDLPTLEALAKFAKVRMFAAKQSIVSELEFGGDVYVMADGRAQVSVQSQRGERVVLQELEPGSAFGEMASITGELRSASVTALTKVTALVITDQNFDRLRTSRPQVASSLVRTLVVRLGEAERTLSSLLNESTSRPARVAPLSQDKARLARGTVAALWRELVVNHSKDLPFLALVAFVATLLVVRLVVFLSFKYSVWPRDVLRAAYVSGFMLVMLCACTAILNFGPRWRRVVVAAFAAGVALIVNELGVTLAFDIFYKDSTTLDPSTPFDIERLYRRTEPARAALVVLALLIQSVYLATFYRRLWALI
ncbi:MAG TPA: cyclic nucleotide-binding domain-containing protein, partial [Polyangiaceae bacterium]